MYAGPPKIAQELFFWRYHLRVSSSNWRKYFVVGLLHSYHRLQPEAATVSDRNIKKLVIPNQVSQLEMVELAYYIDGNNPDLLDFPCPYWLLLYRYWMNEYLNIFVRINMSQMNNWINFHQTKSMNI